MKERIMNNKKEICPNCMDELELQEIQEDFYSDNKVFVYKCKNPECDNEHDGFYYFKDGDIFDGKP